MKPIGRILLVVLAALLGQTAAEQSGGEWQIETVAGNGRRGYSGDGGPSVAAQLDYLPDVAVDGGGTPDGEDIFSEDSILTTAIRGVSTTADDRIVVELEDEDSAYGPHPFDLNGRTLEFTPDGSGEWSRAVLPLGWEEDLGGEVADRARVDLPFPFDFAGQSRDSFHVSSHGVLTFDGPFAFDPTDSAYRPGTMRQYRGWFFGSPTISPRFKPRLWWHRDYHRRHVARRPDRVVVTWFTSHPEFYEQGRRPANLDRFQAVLHADGRISFHYGFVAAGDGIVGLFSGTAAEEKGALLRRIEDGPNFDLPAHLDVLEVTLHESDPSGGVIVEFTTRGGIRRPTGSNFYVFKLHVDNEPPYWQQDDSGWRQSWQLRLSSDGSVAGHRLPSGANNRIAMLISDAPAGMASVLPEAAEWNDDNRLVRRDFVPPAPIRIPEFRGRESNLSRADSRASWTQEEVFHYRALPDLERIVCRLIDVLGDRFDAFTFHGEVRGDIQESGSHWRDYENGVTGIGPPWRRRDPPCDSDRLLGRYAHIVWMPQVHPQGLLREQVLFAHEFGHSWTAYLNYNRDGEPEPLYGPYCNCHWRTDLHLPAAFPWDPGRAATPSIMQDWGSGTPNWWLDNGNGTFTGLSGYAEGGFSWLDLYAMGLAEASEVPDMFIVRNPRRTGTDLYEGDKEVVTIEQVIAAQGPRRPSQRTSQKDFDVGFVYVTEPGRTPSPELLSLHGEIAEAAAEYWFHITGARSRVKLSTGNRRSPRNTPRISSDGIVLATGAPVVNRISPNAIVSVFGSEFAPEGTRATNPALDAAGRVATELAGLCLEIDGKRAPLFAVFPDQINAQAPHDLTHRQTPVIAIRNCGAWNEQRSLAAAVEVAALAPAFFNFPIDADGRNPIVAVRSDGTLAGPPGAVPGVEGLVPAEPGEILTFWGTGFGLTDPPLEAGQIPGGAAPITGEIEFTLGGITLLPEDVLYAGAAPGFAGIYQFAVRVPRSFPDSLRAPVVATVNGVSTPEGPFLTVRRRE